MSDTLVVLTCLLAPLGPIVVQALHRVFLERRLGADSLLAIGVLLTLAWGLVVNAEGAMMRSTLCWNGEPNIDQNVDRVWAVANGQVVSGFVAVADDGPREAFFTRCS
jgi:hypothetical protein